MVRDLFVLIVYQKLETLPSSDFEHGLGVEPVHGVLYHLRCYCDRINSIVKRVIGLPGANR